MKQYQWDIYRSTPTTLQSVPASITCSSINTTQAPGYNKKPSSHKAETESPTETIDFRLFFFIFNVCFPLDNRHWSITTFIYSEWRQLMNKACSWYKVLKLQMSTNKHWYNEPWPFQASRCSVSCSEHVKPKIYCAFHIQLFQTEVHRLGSVRPKIMASIAAFQQPYYHDVFHVEEKHLVCKT